MNEIVPPREIVDGFEEFEDGVEGGEERVNSVVRRPIISFNNEATWVNKDSGEELSADLELVPVKHLRIVQKWKDKLPVEEIVIAPGQKWPDIEKLNDAVPREEWTEDFNGEPCGPWQRQYVVFLLDPRTMDRYTYPTGTKGGGIAVRDLCERIEWMRKFRGACVYPVVRLSDTFMPTKYKGRQRPHFVIVKWITLDGGGGVLSPTEAPALTGPAEVKPPTAKEVVDDEIPL